MLDTTHLIQMIAADPTAYLTEKSLNALDAFLLGAGAALQHHGYGFPYDGFDSQAFREFGLDPIAVTEEHASRLNAFNGWSPRTYSTFLADSAEEAFDLFVMLRKKFLLWAPTTTPVELKRGPKEPEAEFTTLLANIRKRPGIYFGRDWSATDLDNLIAGYLHVECEVMRIASSLERRITGFTAWVHQRYPFAEGRPLSKVFWFVSLTHRHSDVELFLEHLEMFDAGEPPDAPDRVQTEMMNNIIEHARRMGDGADEVRGHGDRGAPAPSRMSPEEIRASVQNYLALLSGETPTGGELDEALGRSLDELALAQHFVPHIFDPADYPDPPSHDDKATRRDVERRFPGYGYYNVAETVLDKLGEAGCVVGDAIDDLVDIANDLRDVEWRWNHTSQDDALWHFANGYHTRWSAHLRGLQQYLLARRGTAA